MLGVAIWPDNGLVRPLDLVKGKAVGTRYATKKLFLADQELLVAVAIRFGE